MSHILPPPFFEIVSLHPSMTIETRCISGVSSSSSSDYCCVLSPSPFSSVHQLLCPLCVGSSLSFRHHETDPSQLDSRHRLTPEEAICRIAARLLSGEGPDEDSVLSRLHERNAVELLRMSSKFTCVDVTFWGMTRRW